VAEAFTHLEFPSYFLHVELSWAKLLGVLLMLAPVPVYPRSKLTSAPASTAPRRSGRIGLIERRRNVSADATNTIRLHRVLRSTPERVYRAFLDPDAMAKWLPPNGFTGKVHHLESKVGGSYTMSFTNFTTGKSHSFGGKDLELRPHERIRHTDKFDDPNLPGEMVVTIELKGYRPSSRWTPAT
jgi:uncharacterized protein YndB with AHSA1/START domain